MSGKCALTVGDLLDRSLGTILNDRPNADWVQHEQWPKASRYDAYVEAICKIRQYRPDAFSEKVEVELIAGQMQELPEGYERVMSVDANADGTKISELDERSNVFNEQISGLPIGCSGGATGDYTATSADVDANNATAFCVTPSVSATQAANNASVFVTAIKCQECVKLDDCVPSQFKAEITDWLLYRMYSFETDSQYLLQKAQQARSNFESSLDKGYRYAAAQGSGYFLGQVGSGDGSFRGRVP